MRDATNDRRASELARLRAEFERQSERWRAAMAAFSTLGSQSLLVQPEFFQELDRFTAPRATGAGRSGVRV